MGTFKKTNQYDLIKQQIYVSKFFWLELIEFLVWIRPLTALESTQTLLQAIRFFAQIKKSLSPNKLVWLIILCLKPSDSKHVSKSFEGPLTWFVYTYNLFKSVDFCEVFLAFPESHGLWMSKNDILSPSTMYHHSSTSKETRESFEFSRESEHIHIFHLVKLVPLQFS